MRIGIVFNEHKENSIFIVKELIVALLSVKHDTAFCLLKEFESCFLGLAENINFFPRVGPMLESSEVVIVVGGDGSVLRYVEQFSHFSVPIVHVGNGRVAHLATLQVSDIYILRRLFTGEFSIHEKMLLEAGFNETESNIKHYALNEVVLTRDVISRVLDFRVSRFEQNLMSFRADGIIVATPCGSSAFSLSSGGPLIHENCGAIVVTPISSMDLGVRPVVLSSDDVVEISYKLRENSEIYVLFDGICRFKLNENRKLTIKKSSRTIKFVKFD